MKIEQWLKDVFYDPYGGQYLWSKQDDDGGSQMVGEVRGWGALQHGFKTPEESAKFQDEVGKFIADAINEKVQRLKSIADPKLIDSMAMRYRHDFGLLSEPEKESIRTTMKQLWEEVVGLGFYKPNQNK